MSGSADGAQSSPTHFLDGDRLEDGIGLCLSGGGYRATLFHAGALLRLNEAGLLGRIDRISSVSGGSIAAGALAVIWAKLEWQEVARTGAVATNLQELFLPLVRAQTADAIDAEAGFKGLLPFRTAADGIAESYADNFAGEKTLQDLPDKPRFVFNSCSQMSGRNWRFAKQYAADWRVGRIDAPGLPLSKVVAASSAFPPFLSPVNFDLSDYNVQEMEGSDLNTPPYSNRIVLTDGGVYDNLGVEPVWKRLKTVLISNASRPFADIADPDSDWLSQMRRTIDILMDQQEAMRERIIVQAYKTGHRRGALWGLQTTLANYVCNDQAGLSDSELDYAKTFRTRLNEFTGDEQVLLIRAGYDHCNAGLRGTSDLCAIGLNIPPPKGLPDPLF